jgi:hypothetical protein
VKDESIRRSEKVEMSGEKPIRRSERSIRGSELLFARGRVGDGLRCVAWRPHVPPYVRYRDENGVWKKESTCCHDKGAAKARQLEIERAVADPAHRAANATTLDTAAADFIDSRKRKGCAAGTLEMYDVKIAHLGRVLGKDTLLSRLGAPAVDRCNKRTDMGAARNTLNQAALAAFAIAADASSGGMKDGDPTRSVLLRRGERPSAHRCTPFRTKSPFRSEPTTPWNVSAVASAGGLASPPIEPPAETATS